METKRPSILARRWLLSSMIVLFGGIGFVIGFQKHVLWLGILLALLGAAYAWLLWVMIRIAIFTILGTLVGAIALGLARSNLWFVGGLVGACLGFLAGFYLHKRALVRGKVSP